MNASARAGGRILNQKEGKMKLNEINAHIVCTCGGIDDDLRILSAYGGKLAIRCRKCGRTQTLRLGAKETAIDRTTDALNRTFAHVQDWIH
jgi:hypothetical protein